VGLTIGGALGNLTYALGVYNGSDGITSGNRLAGMSLVAHLQYHLLGFPSRFVPKDLRISVAGGYMYDKQPALTVHRASGALDLRGWRVRLVGEFLWQRSVPDENPESGAEFDQGEVNRWGVVGQASAFLWRDYLEVAFRYEYFKDNNDLPTFGEQQLFTAGVNVYFCKHRLKLNVNYIRREELAGPEVKNDIAFAQLQAMF
jgi:hypothetical protein